jgi:hypothetical protein
MYVVLPSISEVFVLSLVLFLKKKASALTFQHPRVFSSAIFNATMPQQPFKPITGAPARLYDLDNFRTYLTSLVIYHHTAIPYGGSGNWIYKSQFHSPETSLPLMAFNAINQTYFMVSFFFLSGYFSSRALQRKGVTTFLHTKFVKLGIPTIVFTFFGGPIQNALLCLGSGEKIGSLRWEVLLDHWSSLRGIRGPVWYLALVLVFDTIYALAPSVKAYAAEFNILQSFIWDTSACFLLRLLYPVGTIFTPLNLQLGYTPQYITAYALGASLSAPSPPPMTPTIRNTLIATSIVSAATGIFLFYLYPNSYTFDSIKGGRNLLAFCYAVWNEATGYLIGTSLLELFRTKRMLNRRWANFARYSYPAFLVHPIACVGLQVWSDDWEASGVLKTAVLGTAGVVGSWILGCWMVLNVPGVEEVLM